MRGINTDFILELNSGELHFVLEKAHNAPDDYCVEIRENYINLYYRGGSALRITQKRDGYQFKFDEKYCLDSDTKAQFANMDPKSSKVWEMAFPKIVSEMDNWFKAHHKLER